MILATEGLSDLERIVSWLSFPRAIGRFFPDICGIQSSSRELRFKGNDNLSRGQTSISALRDTWGCNWGNHSSWRIFLFFYFCFAFAVFSGCDTWEQMCEPLVPAAWEAGIWGSVRNQPGQHSETCVGLTLCATDKVTLNMCVAFLAFTFQMLDYRHEPPATQHSSVS